MVKRILTIYVSRLSWIASEKLYKRWWYLLICLFRNFSNDTNKIVWIEGIWLYSICSPKYGKVGLFLNTALYWEEFWLVTWLKLLMFCRFGLKSKVVLQMRNFMNLELHPNIFSFIFTVACWKIILLKTFKAMLCVIVWRCYN